MKDSAEVVQDKENAAVMTDRADANTVAGALLPIPTPVIVRSRLATYTKFFAWLTAFLLSASVFISLISVTSERNDLRSELDRQSTELYCRYAAGIGVNLALANDQIALAHQNVLVGEFVQAVINTPATDPNYQLTMQDLAHNLSQANTVLSKTGESLLEAVKDQTTALQECHSK